MIYPGNYKRIFLFLFIVWTLVCLYATLVPAKFLSGSKLWSYDKVGHFILFLVWSMLLSLVRIRTLGKSPRWLVPFISGCVFGIVIEFLQLYLPINRSFELLDIVADAFGALTGSFLGPLLAPIFAEKAE